VLRCYCPKTIAPEAAKSAKTPGLPYPPFRPLPGNSKRVMTKPVVLCRPKLYQQEVTCLLLPPICPNPMSL
jgi:hypothetical protein